MSDSAVFVLAAGSMLDVPTLEVVDLASIVGYAGVGVRLGSTGSIDPIELSRRANSAGVALHDLEVFRIGTDSRERALELLAFAADAGIERLLVVSDLADVSQTEEELGWVCDEGARHGVSVALEYMAWVTPCTSEGAARLARSTGCSVVVDALHHHRLGEDSNAIRELRNAGLLGWFQICDAPRAAPLDLVAEARGGRLCPGEGELPLRDHVDALGPGVTVSVEVQGLEERFPDALTRARRLFQAAHGVVGSL